MAGERPADEGDALTGLQRVSRLFSYTFARHEAGAEVPEMPEEFRDWATDSLTAMLAGLFLGGGAAWLRERNAGLPQPPADAPSKLHAARAIAEANTQRLARISNASLHGGLLFGGLASIFFGVRMLSAVYRNRHDFLNDAHGGMAAGAAFGLSLHRNLKPQAPAARSVVLGAALGTSIGLPLGLLQDRLIDLLPAEHQLARARRRQQLEQVIQTGVVEPERKREAAARRGYDATAAVIQQLEASLSSSPTRQQQQQQGEQQQGEEGEGQQGEQQAGGEAQQHQQQGRWWKWWRR